MDGFEPIVEVSPRRGVLGRLLTAVGAFVLLLVFGVGIGLPRIYWDDISDVQAFEGDEGVVLFVEAQRSRQTGGVLTDAPIRKPVQMLRFDITAEGRVDKTPLSFAPRVNFNTNTCPIIRLPGDFYPVQGRSMGRPSCQLHRVIDARIESLDIAESVKILESIGLDCDPPRQPDDFRNFDRISRQHGWMRINGSSYSIRYGSEPIVSRRHKFRLRHVEVGPFRSILAESFSGPNEWSKPLVTIDSTPWKSRRDPMD